MKLIAGLGNPGNEYEMTRHNAGFLMIDRRADWEKIKRSTKKEWNAMLGKGVIHDEEVLLCKPLTYMNKSGESISKIAIFYKIKPEDILIIHDEIDLVNGEIQLKKGGGHAGHNGLKSIIQHLGTNTFSRIRIGVGRPETKEEVVNYVLHPFSKNEWKAIESKEQEIGEMIRQFVEK